MFLTIFLAVVFCAAITIMLISAVAFIQDNRFFSSAPKEAQKLIKPREKELFHGARAMGWVMMIISILMILGWDLYRSGTVSGAAFLSWNSFLVLY